MNLADVSFYQDDNGTPQGIDFEKMATKAPCVIIRAGQGAWIDPDFNTNWQASKAAGMDRGSYWFYDNRYSPDTQVNLMKSVLKDDQGEGIIWLDLEHTVRGDYSGWKQWYNTLVKMQEAFPDKIIGIYTAPAYWKENTVDVGISEASLEWFAQFPLWIANYQVNSPTIPAPWSEYQIWQWGTPAWGREWGVESLEIDMNEMDEQWYEFCFGGEVPTEPEIPPVVEPEEPTSGKVIATAGLNIRTEPNGTKVGGMWYGSEFEIDEVDKLSDNEIWVKPNVWVAAKFVEYIKLSEPVTDTPNIFPESGIQQYFTVPNDGDYIYLPNDWQSADRNFTSRCDGALAMPQTVPLQYRGKEEWFEMDREKQEWIHALIKYCSPYMTDEQIKETYLLFIADKRAFTDNHAPENGYEEYIYGTGGNNGIGYMWKGSISCGGNICRVIDSDSTHYIVEAIDVDKPLPSLAEIVEKRHLLHWATQIWKDKFDDKTFKTTHFPHGRGSDGEKHGTLIPLFGKGGVRYVAKELIVNDRYNGFLSAGQKYQSVNLERWK